MRGGFIHNRVLIAPIEAFLVQCGAYVRREYPTGPGRTAGFVDLFASYGAHRIVCEAELTADRVARDVDKAVALNATLLLIVVPRSRVARAVRKHLSRLAQMDFDIWVSTVPVALQRLSDLLGFDVGHQCPANKKQIQEANGGQL